MIYFTADTHFFHSNIIELCKRPFDSFESMHKTLINNWNIDQINKKVGSDECGFLRKDVHLGKNIIILTLGGSYAYGTNNEESDLDVRGCALNSKREILTNQDFEQFTNEKTDTTIYSFGGYANQQLRRLDNKAVRLVGQTDNEKNIH